MYITLPELRSYALAHPDHEYPLGDLHCCLVCEMLKDRGLEFPEYQFNGRFDAQKRVYSSEYPDNSVYCFERVRIDTPSAFTKYALTYEQYQTIDGLALAEVIKDMMDEQPALPA